MKSIALSFFSLLTISFMLMRCNNDESVSAAADSSSETVELLDVAQTSGQLASGTSFRINGSSTDSAGHQPGGDHHHHGAGHHDRHSGILDGVNLLAPTNELLAIVDAESASDFRGLRISQNGGASITHYNAAGEMVSLPVPREGGPNGCSFSGNEHPQFDSLLSTIVKTEIDFGSGVTFHRDTVTITRSGKIIIERSGDPSNTIEVTTFENYFVNGAQIEGTKTRVSTFDEATGNGTSTTAVSNGKITFADGTVAMWTSDKTRATDITLDANGHPASGTIVTEVNTAVVASDGTVIYSHKTSSPLTENVACERRRHGPVSGVLETVYGADKVVVNFGDGTCENSSITITLNGVSVTKTIGG
jgi:hypothetical protein